MKEYQDEIDNIINILLVIPDHQRAEVLRNVRNNPFFCCECGYGSKENPNTRCQCWNDE